jgi:hypothetical protein
MFREGMKMTDGTLTMEMVEEMMALCRDAMKPRDHMVINSEIPYNDTMNMIQAKDRGLLDDNVHVTPYIDKEHYYLIPAESYINSSFEYKPIGVKFDPYEDYDAPEEEDNGA